MIFIMIYLISSKMIIQYLSNYKYESMKIAIIGAGYVGLVTAACFSEVGHSVLCIDINKKRLEI